MQNTLSVSADDLGETNEEHYEKFKRFITGEQLQIIEEREKIDEKAQIQEIKKSSKNGARKVLEEECRGLKKKMIEYEEMKKKEKEELTKYEENIKNFTNKIDDLNNHVSD